MPGRSQAGDGQRLLQFVLPSIPAPLQPGSVCTDPTALASHLPGTSTIAVLVSPLSYHHGTTTGIGLSGLFEMSWH